MTEIVPILDVQAHRVIAACDADGRVFAATVTITNCDQTLRVAPIDSRRSSPINRALEVHAASIPEVRLAATGDGRLLALWTQSGPVGMQLCCAVRARGGRWGEPAAIAGPFGGALAPAVTVDRHDRLWCAYQSTATGKHHIFVTWLTADEWAFGQRISDGDGHCFAPSICPFANGVRVVWDGRIDGRYGVWMREVDTESDLTQREDQAVIVEADTLLANASIAALDDERSVVVYERAQDGWGRRNRTPRGSREQMSEGNYLGARRDLRAVMIGPEGMAGLSGKLNRTLNDAIPSPVRTQPRVAVDGSGGLWLSWRQIHSLADAPGETGFVAAVSAYRQGAFGPPVILPESGGTSAMEAHFAADPAGGVLLAYSGRTDGRYHGHVVALPAVGRGGPVRTGKFRPMEICDFDPPTPSRRIGLGDPYGSPQLLWGDLHRHTNLSDCRWWIEGSPADAYRYALAAAELDFVAVTDHMWSVATPDTAAEGFDLAAAYNMPGVFTAFCAYEASFFDGGDGHMVVLSDRQLRRGGRPKSRRQLAKGVDPVHTLIIPHHTGDRQYGYSWDGHDDRIAPVAEIYQPYRGSFERENGPAPPTAWRNEGNTIDPDRTLLAAWRAGLKLGVVASSDHLATAGAFAGVWADANTRRDILDALRLRRCFAATTKIELAFWADDRFMGESFTADRAKVAFTVRCRADAVIDRIDLLADGDVVHTFRPAGRTGRRRATVRKQLPIAAEEHFYCVRIRLRDANIAWSSPIWITGP